MPIRLGCIGQKIYMLILLSAKQKNAYPNSLSLRSWDAFVFVTSPLFLLGVIWR